MAEHHITANKTQNEEERDDMDDNNSNNGDAEATEASRKERRKLAKKEKRKKKRKELAEMARQLEEARLNDPEELRRLQAEEEMEKARIEKERLEFEEREKKILEEWERRRALEEEEEERRRRAREEEDRLKGNKDENDMDEDGWEYVEEGPPEIIWKGNEIIVQKKKVRVKKNTDQQITKEDPNRPTSNPLPPQSEAFASYTNGAIPSAQQLLENVANQTPNFGTEQDKAHCPFHHKTGACRFGTNCSRIHFYPDKSCTLLIKNMYNGPGLAWEQDEGLECTDEEVEHAYEEFYEDVHTEFLKFGEIINFKVCKNCSPHLRGNVYVHYKSLDSAVLAYKSLNGRYFAGKQVQCEFVSLTKWRVAICGEFMRSKLKTCSRGVACNFIHCFQNPGGDYEWADWDKPPPRYWVQRMVALFGCSGESAYEIERESPKSHSSRKSTVDADRSHHFRRSQSRDIDYSRGSRNHYEDDTQSRAERRQHRRATSRTPELDEKHRNDRSSSRSMQHRSDASTDSDTDRTMPERERTRHGSKKRSRFHINRSPESIGRKIEIHEADADLISSDEEKYHKHNSTTHKKRRTQEVGRGCNAKSKEISSVKGKGKDVRQHRKVSKSPDDCCMDDRRTDKGKSTGSRCNRKDEYTCAEKCSTPDDYEEYGNEKSKANHSIRRGGDSKHASTERSYGIYGSRSRKFTSKWEREDSGRKYKKEPKRKREAENSDPESQLRRLEGRRSSMADDQFEDQFDEDTEDRGRWEPE